MASPQKENGYTAIANELLEEMLKSEWSGQDFKVVLLVARKTYGFHKTEDFIALSQIQQLTGMSKVRCSQVVNRLQLMKILTVTENINGFTKKYKLNKNFDEWLTVNEFINRYRKTKQTVKVLRNRPLRKILTTKETITKETITKEKPPISPKNKNEEIILPEWLSKELWEQFKEHRKIFKPKLSHQAEQLNLNKLIDLHNRGHDPKVIIEEAIAHGWKSFYEPKNKPTHPLKGKFSDKTIQNIENFKTFIAMGEE